MFYSNKKIKAGSTEPINNVQIQKDVMEDQIKAILDNIKVEVNVGPFYKAENENEVIDVSDEAYDITPQGSPDLINPVIEVPYWSHSYVYSADEIKYASRAQQEFYKILKANFLNGICLDVKGNSNYYFVLFFDLLKDYDQGHGVITLLEDQLDVLVQAYPKTKSYAKNELVKRLQSRNDHDGVARILYQKESFQNDIGYLYGLGDKFKSKLSLSKNQINQLNQLTDTANKFNSIEYCGVELIKMFFSVIEELEAAFQSKGSTLKEQIDAVAALEIEKHYRYKYGTYNYHALSRSFIATIYQIVYKSCENRLRDYFCIGRKTELSWYLHSTEAITEFNERFKIVIDNAIEKAISQLSPTDIDAETAFNEYNKSRWKKKLEELERSYSPNDKDAYVNKVHELEKCNQNNPSIENIFLQASKFIAKHNKVQSLKFYVHYLHYDLRSSKFDNRQLTKTIQKSLFQSNEQLHEFERIIGDLIKTKDMATALQSVELLYTPKRKKIKLDTTSIKEVHDKHAGTVNVLSEYLRDEYEDEQTNVRSEQISSSEVQINITQKNQNSNDSQQYVTSINQVQSGLVELFIKNCFTLSAKEMDDFARSNSAFKNQLVESINDTFYDHIDDVLIEEDEESYTMNESYYQKIITQ